MFKREIIVLSVLLVFFLALGAVFGIATSMQEPEVQTDAEETDSPSPTPTKSISERILDRKKQTTLILNQNELIKPEEVRKGLKVEAKFLELQRYTRVIQGSYSDFTGDGVIDSLVWIMESDKPFSTESQIYGAFHIIFQDGKSGHITLLNDIFVDKRNGYDFEGVEGGSKLIVHDFNGDGVEDIFMQVSILTPYNPYIYKILTLADGEPQLLLEDSDYLPFYNNEIDMEFTDDYKMIISHSKTGFRFEYDLKARGEDYFNENYAIIYENGKPEDKPMIVGIDHLEPVHTDKDRIYELSAKLKVHGPYHHFLGDLYIKVKWDPGMEGWEIFESRFE